MRLNQQKILKKTKIKKLASPQIQPLYWPERNSKNNKNLNNKEIEKFDNMKWSNRE